MDNTQNNGSFMSPVGNGIGPALQQILAQRQQGGQVPALAQNSQQPGGIPAAPPPAQQTATPIPGAQPTAAPAQPTVPQGPAGGTAPELTIALNALAQYIKSHGKVAEATNGVQ